MLRIAAIQLRASGDKARTLERASSLIKEAAARGAKLVCLPEAWTGLYGVEHFESNAEVLGAAGTGSALMANAAKKHSVFVCGGVIEDCATSTQQLHNTIVAYGPHSAEPVAAYRKMHLSKVKVGPDATSEGSVLTAGTELGYFDIHLDNLNDVDADVVGVAAGALLPQSWRVGLCCCFDLRFGGLASVLGTGGLRSDLLLYPSAWLQSTGQLGHWDTLLKARALDNQCYVAAPNQAEDLDTDGTIMYGDTVVIDPMGQRAAEVTDSSADEIVFADLSLEMLRDSRDRIPLSSCAATPESLATALKRAGGGA